MLAHGGGKIINTASMASLIVPHPQKQAEPISANSCMNLGEFFTCSSCLVKYRMSERERPRHPFCAQHGGASLKSLRM